MWVANSDCIQAPVIFPHLIEGGNVETYRERERRRESSRCVLSLAVQTIYCSQTQARKQIQAAIDRDVVNIIGECYSPTRSPTFIWPRVWAKQRNWCGIDQNACTALSFKGDFIDLPKSFFIVASVKCRNSSFRWRGIGEKNTPWTIYRSLK